MGEWKEYRISEIASVKSGKRLPKGHSLVNEKTDYRYIKGRDIRGGKVNDIGLQYLLPDTKAKIKKYIVNKRDVLITIVANVGDVGIVPDGLDGTNLTENAVRLTNFTDDVWPEFLTYLLATSEYKKYMESLAVGAAQSKLAIYKIKKIKVSLPSLPEQRRIASLLSSYDDLIETNNRRIALLEESARELYKEWFVRFRFPGYQHSKFVKGLPVGWEEVPFRSRIDVLSGGTPSTTKEEYYANGQIPFYTPKDAPANIYCIDTLAMITEAGLAHCNSALFPKGTVIVTARGTVGKLAILQRPMAMNQSCFALQWNDGTTSSFLFFEVERIVEVLKKAANGGVFDAINLNTFKMLSLQMAPSSILKEFEARVSPYMSALETLIVQNAELAAARDRLLPRLISGKIRV